MPKIDSKVSKQGKRKNSLSDREKYAILEWMKRNKANQRQTYSHFGIKKSTMSDIVRDGAGLKKMAESGELGDVPQPTVARARGSHNVRGSSFPLLPTLRNTVPSGPTVHCVFLGHC